MGLLKTIVQQLQARSGVTPVTPVTNDGVTAKPSTGAGCTPVTPVTPQNRYDGKAIMQPPMPAANEPSIADWKTLDRAYLAHHVQCPQCIAAGRGYGQRCGTGATLWRSYQAAPTPFNKKPKAKPIQQPIEQQSKPLPPDLAALLDAAMLACDFWGDDADKREAMRQDCLTVPVHQRRALTEHFHELYGRNSHD